MLLALLKPWQGCGWPVAGDSCEDLLIWNPEHGYREMVSNYTLTLQDCVTTLDSYGCDSQRKGAARCESRSQEAGCKEACQKVVVYKAMILTC